MAKNLFFRIFRKNVEFFSMNSAVNNFRNCFSMNSAEKNFEFFFNSLKLTIENFRNFLLLNSLKNNFENCLLLNSLKKNSTLFRKIRKKFFATKKKRVTEGGEKSRQFFQENPTRPFVGFWYISPVSSSFFFKNHPEAIPKEVWNCENFENNSSFLPQFCFIIFCLT